MTGPKRPEAHGLVLIADDFADSRDMMGDYLRHWGYDVAGAADGAEAIRRAEELLPDVILMDLSMPIVDGWEATRRLKAGKRTAHIPIIALTSHALTGASDPALAAGCDAFVVRPCPPDRVLAEVERAMGRAAQRRHHAKNK
jgi:two-component system cell cycle response regulator DivK